MTRQPVFAALALAVLAAAASAHCDSLDGPVVQVARQALAAGDVAPVLPWVRPHDETTIRRAFARALSVRKLNPEAGELADTWFFETLVRIHRAGEGAPYTGLKPAGDDPGPAVATADRAIASGTDTELSKLLTTAAAEGLHRRFHRVLETRSYKPSDVAAGRQYVAAYVDFVHFAERLHQAAASGTGEATGHHQH